MADAPSLPAGGSPPGLAVEKNHNPCSWATWPAALALIALWLVWRLIHLRFFDQAELLGDEANYWECARRLQLAYHFSGPGIAVVVWAMRELSGDVAWAMRFPAAIAMAVSAWVAGRFAISLSGDQRAGFFAAVAFLLFPLTAIWSVLITYDPLYITCWLVATYSLWLAVREHRAGRRGLGWWVLLGLALGLGFLLKYTIVLLVPGLFFYLILQRRSIRWDGRLWGGIALSLVIFILAIAPIWIWNQQEGWPTITYLRGHLNSPTDTARRVWTPEWPLQFIGAQVGLMGPPAAILAVAAIAALWRRRRQDQAAWDYGSLLLSSAGAIILFFTLATLKTRSEANWAVAGYGPLAVLLGLYTAEHCRAGVCSNFLRRGWWWLLGFGLFAYVMTTYPVQIAQLPVVGKAMPLERFRDARNMAAQVEQLRAQIRTQTGQEPLIIAKTYLTASQTAYYLPDHPSTYTAASYLGWRRSTYDFWDDTDLTSPAIRGRPAILLGADPPAWRGALILGDVRQVVGGPKPIYVADNYQGVRPAVQAHGGKMR